MKYRFFTADVFTDRPFSGNPLAVFPWAAGLAIEQMQAIAGELNLSETAFVLPPEDPANSRRVRIFTPAGELPFAGHPTVGTAYVLVLLGEIPAEGADTRIILEEGVGPVSVTVHARDGVPTGATLSVARLPEFGPPPPESQALAEVVCLDASDLLMGEFEPQGVSCGSPYLFIPVRDRATLARARLDLARWERVLSGAWASKPYIFCFDPERPGSDVRARMFSPAAGGREDPATGAAASALAGYLGARRPERDGTLRWRVEQGFEMGRPSILRVEADKRDGQIVAVRVGGDCVLVSEGEMTVR